MPEMRLCPQFYPLIGGNYQLLREEKSFMNFRLPFFADMCYTEFL